MTNEETALADKILKEATEAPAHSRKDLIEQYDRVIRAALNRREVMEPRCQLGIATALLSTDA
jgi:hypothetical protein